MNGLHCVLRQQVWVPLQLYNTAYKMALHSGWHHMQTLAGFQLKASYSLVGAATHEGSLGGDILQFHRRTVALKLQNDPNAY